MKTLTKCKNCEELIDIAEHNCDMCMDCCDKDQMSYEELANLNHKTQVEKFNWCACEEQEDFPYEDCPRKNEGK